MKKTKILGIIVIGVIFAHGVGNRGFSAPNDTIGVAECDKYISAFKACVQKMPLEVRPTYEATLKQLVDTWSATAASGPEAKNTLAIGCKAAYDAQAASMKQFGCKW